MSQTSVQPQVQIPPVEGRVRAITWRSVLLGIAGVLFICGLTAYNDYVVANTFMVGNFLPIGLLLFLLTFILLVNGPLCRWAPRLALTRGELGVALCMMLISCVMPSSGLMRYLPAQLVSPWYHAGSNGDYANVLKGANPPDWLFPQFTAEPNARATDPLVKYYWQRIQVENDTFLEHFRVVPWGAWVRPMLVWGILVGCVVGAMLCLSVVFRRQWVENERLPYPLANVYLSVVEEPAPGKMLNTLFSSPWFWAAAAAVFTIHGFNAMAKYYPRIWPQIPINFAFWGIFGNPPLSYTDWGFKAATLYFSMVGIVYFLQSNVAFSLWFMFILMQVTRMFYGSYQAEFTQGMQQDQNLGAALMFAATVVYIGRHQLLLVATQMFRKPRPGEAQGRYLPYFLAGWGLLLCTAGMVAWFMVAGVTLVGALLIVGMAGVLYLTIARVVAETGLMFVQVNVPMVRPWVLLAQSMPESLAVQTTARNFFFTGWISAIFVHDQRESLSGFMPQALRVADGAAYENEKNWKRAIPFTGVLLLAMVLGYAVSGASMLYTEYTYGATLDRTQVAPINKYGVDDATRGQVLDPTKDYLAKGGPSENHNRWAHVGIGAGITGALGALRLRFANWPLHPIGYILVFAYPMQKIWFSILVGWLAKVLIVRFGGASMYRSIKPLFVGLIIGEVGASAFWLVVSLALNAMGYQYNAVNLLPT